MLVKLKRETESWQRAADTDRLAVMSATPATYRTYLARIWGFEAPVEAALAMTVGLEDWIDLRARTNHKLLRADLAALGVIDPTHLPRCPNVFPFRGPAHALGWIYVLERNTLLHGLLDRTLRQRMPDQMKLAGSYLGMQARSAGERWRELGEALDKQARRPPSGDAIVAAARSAFRAQRAWYALSYRDEVDRPRVLRGA